MEGSSAHRSKSTNAMPSGPLAPSLRTSVGQLTHGTATLDDVRGNSDVVELLNRPSPAG